MKKISNIKQTEIPVTLIVPVYNVESILADVLNSIKKQEYPIKEIIIIDNKSTDTSLQKAREFKQKNKRLAIQIITRDKTYGISSSYNLGARLSKSPFFVTLHSDSILSTRHELRKLVSPILNDERIVATFPLVVHTRQVWLTYNFWQKCLFASVVDTKHPSMNGKFDCYRRSTFLRINGYDEKKFSHFLGTEDADMHHRLERAGIVFSTNAEVIHLHGTDKNYSLRDWISRRKFLARSYGRYIQLHLKDMKKDVILFFVKPLLAAITLLGFVNPIFFLPILFIPNWNMKRMYLDTSTQRNPRIFLLPFINIYLVYLESYLMLRMLLSR